METTIEKLSDDVLLEILSKLDACSLKSASLVCKNWNDIISLSPSTMKKFHLKLLNRQVVGEDGSCLMSWMEKFDEIMQLERKHQSMTVFLNSLQYKQAVEMLLDISARNGSQVRSLTLNESEFVDTKDFCELLENLPLLEDLELNKVTFKSTEMRSSSSIKPVVLKELKSLMVTSSSFLTFQCLIGSQITSLRIFFKMARITDRQCLINFLECSKKLETVEIDSRVFVNLFQTKFTNHQFPFALRWIKFPWHFPQTEIGDADENFGEFLEAQSAIEDLQLNYVAPKLLETILVKMKALKKLRLNVSTLPDNMNFYVKFKPQLSLKELIAHDRFASSVASVGLLSLFPSLESLVMIHEHDLIATNLELFPRLNSKLKRLSMETLNFNISAGMKLEYLKFLHLERITNIDYIVAFLQVNQTVDTLSVKLYEEDSATDIVNVLFDQTSLTHFQFIGVFLQMQEIYEHIKADHRNLETLKLTIMSNKYGDANPKVSFFELPRDGSKWNPKYVNCCYLNKQ